VSIHARGNIRWMTEQELIAFLKKLTLHYEGYDKSASPVYDNLPEEYTSRLIKGIIGFELEVNSLENVYKLSQTRDKKSYDSIVNELKQKGASENEIAAMMEERKKKLFPSS
jgi:transcriptional regulator